MSFCKCMYVSICNFTPKPNKERFCQKMEIHVKPMGLGLL